MVFKKGHKHTELTLNKLKESMIGNSNAKGYKHTKEAKKRIGDMVRGRKLSKEQKEKISKKLQGRKVNWGDKISQKLRSRRLSEEHRKNLSLAWDYNKHFSKQTKNKISESLKKMYINGEKVPICLIGEKNPSWLGGKSFEPYGIEFNKKFKRLIRKRDNYICLKCLKHQEKENKSLCIHHIDYNKKLSIPQNCCALCHKCNIEVNKNRKHWTKFFQSLLAGKYVYEYSETGEIVLNLKNFEDDLTKRNKI